MFKISKLERIMLQENVDIEVIKAIQDLLSDLAITYLKLDCSNDPLTDNLDLDSNKIVNLLDPINNQDAATKAYADSVLGVAPNFAFKTITGITEDLVADSNVDTLTLSSANNKLTIVGTALTDTITFTIDETKIDHDNLLNFDALEHYTKGSISIADLGTKDHHLLDGLLDDDHAQYLLINGTRAMSGGLDMGANAITNVGNVDGVDISGIVVFKSINCPAGTNPVADLLADTLNITATGDITITGNAGTDTIDFSVTKYTNLEAVAAINAAGLNIATTKLLAFVDGGSVDIIRDEDNMVSNDENALATQQSIKAYVDAAGAGENNTASNQGVGGVGLYNAKVGVDLQFRNINAGSNKITVVLDAGNKEVDIDVVPGNLGLLANIVEDITPQLGGDLDLNEKSILIDPSLTTNLEYEGIVLELTVSGLTVGQCVYVNGNNTGALADADTVGTMPAVGVYVGTNLVLTHGIIRQDTWTWTAGQRLYVGTDGNLTSTVPSGTGDYVEIMGIAVNATAVLIMPSLTEVKRL